VKTRIPRLELPTTDGYGIDLLEAAQRLLVVYAYPMTAGPDGSVPPGWDEIPGARGCTPQSCAFRDHHAEIAAHGARVLGLSAQTTAYQAEVAERLRLQYPLASDPLLTVAGTLEMPTFDAPEVGRLYERLTFVARDGEVVKVFHPIDEPARNAEEVLEWLTQHA
jgi:peroxiredoxin